MSGAKYSQKFVLKVTLIQFHVHMTSIVQNMSVHVVIRFGRSPGSNQKVTFKFTFLNIFSLFVNILFCHEDGGVELCKLDIIIVAS